MQMDIKESQAILISDKVDFKTKATAKDKKVYYITIKGTIQKEDVTIVNIHTPNMGAPKHKKQILTDIKGETHSNTVMIEDFKITFTSMDRSDRKSRRNQLTTHETS